MNGPLTLIFNFRQLSSVLQLARVQLANDNLCVSWNDLWTIENSFENPSFRLDRRIRRAFSDRPRREPAGPRSVRFLRALLPIPARFDTGHTVHGGGRFNGSDLVLFLTQSCHSAGEWRNFPVTTAGVRCRAGVTVKVKTRPAPIRIGFERRSVVVRSGENNVPRFAATPSPLPLTRNRVIISDIK